MSWKAFWAMLCAMVCMTAMVLAYLSRPKYVSLPNMYNRNYSDYSGKSKPAKRRYLWTKGKH